MIALVPERLVPLVELRVGDELWMLEGWQRIEGIDRRSNGVVVFTFAGGGEFHGGAGARRLARRAS